MRVYKNATVYRQGRLRVENVAVFDGRIRSIGVDIPIAADDEILDAKGKLLTPGLADVHVHLREPGFSYKETIASGTRAAARGGYTIVCSMPNLDPAPDCLENLQPQLDLIRKDAVVRVYPYGTLTRGRRGEGEVADYKGMADYVIGFSDDGKGVQDAETMRKCMKGVVETGLIIAAHCEDDALVNSGHSAESEFKQIERDVELAGQVGCRYHVCHISTAESVDIIRRAKRRGIDVTCETAPHYIALCDENIYDDGRFKMNPPIRSRRDRDAIIEGLLDGTIDMIATDHAPHSAEEKGRGLQLSQMGIVGLETAFGVLYTKLVLSGILPLEKLLYLMCDAPRARFGLPGGIEAGAIGDMALFDLETQYTIDPDSFASKGRSTPFAGMSVRGRCDETMVAGKVVYSGAF